MAHTYDLATDIGKVRLAIRDIPDVGRALAFTDAEIQVFIDSEGSWQRAVAAAARALLADAARFAVVQTAIGEGESDRGDRSPFVLYLRDIIERYGGQAAALPLAVVSYGAAHPSDPITT